MRKSKILFICDTVFWYIIYFLPVIMYGIYMIHASENSTILTMEEFIFYNLGTAISISYNPIYNVLNSLFGSSGILHVFGDSSYILVILTYFASMVIIHLCIDFVLFIPRLCHKWLDMYCKGVEK